MIDKKIATKHIARLVGLNFFPPKGAGREELVTAGAQAKSEAILDSVVSDWLAEATEAPKPAQLRAMILPLNEAAQLSRATCLACEGTGMITWWFLVTYKGLSFVIEDHERLRDVTTEHEAREYTERVKRFLEQNPKAKRQSVLSAAKSCVCREFNRRTA